MKGVVLAHWQQLPLLVSLALFGCGSADALSAADQGRELFSDPSVSSSSLNRFSCSTCHDASTPLDGARKPGANLAGSTRRPSFWGGQERDLLRSINACRRYFMQEPDAWLGDEPEATALFAFLSELEPGDADPVPFNLVRSVQDVPRASATEGGTLFQAACASCHGAKTSGVGRLTPLAPALPESTLLSHAEDSAATQRLIFVQKTRHGGFLGYGGNMPPFSAESLSDQELGAILEFLGVVGTDAAAAD